MTNILTYNNRPLRFNNKTFNIPFSDMLKTGLVSYWNFNEVSGNILDSVGTNNGTISGTVTQNQTGKLGKCIYVDGVSGNYILLSSNITTGTTFSIAGWIQRDDTATDAQGDVIVTNSDTVGVSIWHSSANAGKMCWYNGAANKLSTIAIANLTWGHFVFVVNSGSYIWYINGSPAGTGTGISTTNLDRMLGHTGNTEDLKGYLDELSIWNRALSLLEVQQLYNSGIGLSYPFE